MDLDTQAQRFRHDHLDGEVTLCRLNLLLAYAVKVGELAVNPLAGLRISNQATLNEVDPQSVVNPKQARQLLATVTYAGRRPGVFDYLYRFRAAMYYAGDAAW